MAFLFFHKKSLNYSLNTYSSMTTEHTPAAEEDHVKPSKASGQPLIDLVVRLFFSGAVSKIENELPLSSCVIRFIQRHWKSYI